MIPLILLLLKAVADVQVLTQSNFDSTVKQNEGGTLILFYAPWCGHCKVVLVDFERASLLLEQKASEVRLAKVDCDTETKLTEIHQVKGFPTLKLHYKGNWIDYSGGRTYQAMVAWVTKWTGEIVKPLQSDQELQSFTTTYKMTCLYFGNDEKEVAAFSGAAKEMKDVMFGLATYDRINAPLPKSFDDKLASNARSAIVMFFPHDEGVAIFQPTVPGLVTQSEIISFVKKYRLPNVVPFSGEVSQDIFTDSRPLLFLFRDAVNETSILAESKFREAALQLPSILCSISGITDPMDQRLMDYLGVSAVAGEVPALRLITSPLGDKSRYRYAGEWTTEGIVEFVANVEAGQIKKHLKSEPAPKEPLTKDNILVVVGKTYQELVIDNPKDVFVQFYAPWCGHCKKMEPVMRELGERYKGSQKVVIAKFDATTNDADFEIQGFPLVRLYLANDKANPITYEGDRETANIVEWITRRTTRVQREEAQEEL